MGGLSGLQRQQFVGACLAVTKMAPLLDVSKAAVSKG
jgi:predicted transcriptional regulator